MVVSVFHWKIIPKRRIEAVGTKTQLWPTLREIAQGRSQRQEDNGDKERDSS